MTRLQRYFTIFLISLFLIVYPVWLVNEFYALLWAAPGDLPAEMLTISTTPIGPTPALCLGPAGQYRTIIFILDQPAYVTIHGPSATPSSTLGMLMGPGSSVTVDHANEFKAVRSGATDARAYVVCIPR